MRPSHFAAACLVLGTAAPAFATEGGGSIYALGVNGLGCCALPPPGHYMMVDVQHYRAGEVKDDSGTTIPIPGFKVHASAIAPRFVWVTSKTVLGGSLALHTIVPVVDLDVTVPGGSQHKTGVGDIVFGPSVGWHHSPQLHSVAAIDFFAPTGGYDRNDIANIGRSHWAMHLVGGVSYIQPAGLNADAKVMYGINARNKDTDYRDGDEFIVDYAVGWGFGNGWTLGVGGYFYDQLTNDRQAGATVANNKGRSYAIGPTLRYDSGKGWFLTAKAYSESGVRNRAAGDSIWLRAVFPL